MPPIAENGAPRPAPKPKVPHLTNRGAAGLLSKVPQAARDLMAKTPTAPTTLVKASYRIVPALQHLAVPIDSVFFDPENARLHPERNKEAIRRSLEMYGQTTPIVVQKSTMKVVAGNGRLEVARELGWTEIAATIIDMTDLEAAGYGLADNRTAELAKWDFEVVARLDKLLMDAGHDSVGWSSDELAVLRTDWTQFPGAVDSPPEDPEGKEKEEGDAELLMRLKVTIDEPKTQVEKGQVWCLGRHRLIIACVVREPDLWAAFVCPETRVFSWQPVGNVLFCPYPGPLVPLTLAGDNDTLVMVQPDPYTAGHIIDYYKQIHGEKEVSLASY